MKAMFQMNVGIEVFSVLLCLILLIYTILDKENRTKSNRWFIAMIATNIVMLVGDMIDWAHDGMPGTLAYYTLWTGTILYYLGSAALVYTLMGYLLSLLEDRVKIPKFYSLYAAFNAVLELVLCIFTIFSHKCYYIDSANHYQRGEWYVLIQIPLSVYVVALIFFIVYRKHFKKREIFYLSIFIFVPAIGTVIQSVFYGIAALNTSISLGFVLLFVFVQTQGRLESKTEENEIIMSKNSDLESKQEYQEKLIPQIISALAYSVEAKDIYTRGHSVRVANYTREIVHRMGGNDRQQMDAYYMGLLHDIGKIRVPDIIINKDGKLSENEYQTMKLHTISGFHILKDITAFPELQEGARWHHEHYDGTGYPNGLKGDNIPLLARIISVADAYDAMTSNRSYRSIMTQDAVRAEIEKGAGTQFDPKVVKIMLEMIDEDIQYEMRQITVNKEENILLIDDDEINHRFVEMALKEGPNYMLTSAYSGKEGIELMEREDFDLCLLDVEMPEMGGFEVMEWIRKNRRRMKVILLTGNKDMEVVRRGRELGVSDYMTKPIMIPILNESIKNVLAH